MFEQDKSYICGEATAKRGRIRRSLLTMDGPLMTAENSDRKTLWENWLLTLKEHGNREFLGERYLENGTLTGFKYQTYREIHSKLEDCRSGMIHFGVQPRQHIALYCENRSEWQIVDLAMQSIGVVTIPLYDTLGPDAAAYVLENAECVACVTSMPGLKNVLNSKSSYLKLVVVVGPRTFEPKEKYDEYQNLLKAVPARNIKIVDFSTVIKEGSRNPYPAEPPKGADLATICYTSGTTGVPKGVTLTHNNLMTQCFALFNSMAIYPGDGMLAYLPLAHMYERIMEILTIRGGSKVGYFRGDTLLLLEDLAACQPTVFCGVPRLFNRIYDKIMTQINESSFLKKKLFHQAYTWKKKNLEANGDLTSKFDFVFSKIRNVFGGKVRLMTTGSAPISPVIMEFLRICGSCPVLEGYGQTETSAVSTVTLREDQVGAGFVGVPAPCAEVALFDVPEMNYTQKDMVDGKIVERGEICARGPHVTAGYWKMPEKTRSLIDEEGWCHSGDIGMWMPNGYLKIIDRKKNIFKLSQGEYVAPEKIENVYTVSSFIAQAFVYGDSLKPSLVAIIVPDEEVVIPWLKSQGIVKASLREACQEPSLKAVIEEDIERLAIERGLHGFERAKSIHLHDELFTLENGLLTPTFKLRRPEAKKIFLDDIKKLYSKAPSSRSKL